MGIREAYKKRKILVPKAQVILQQRVTTIITLIAQDEHIKELKNDTTNLELQESLNNFYHIQEMCISLSFIISSQTKMRRDYLEMHRVFINELIDALNVADYKPFIPSDHNLSYSEIRAIRTGNRIYINGGITLSSEQINAYFRTYSHPNSVNYNTTWSKEDLIKWLEQFNHIERFMNIVYEKFMIESKKAKDVEYDKRRKADPFAQQIVTLEKAGELPFSRRDSYILEGNVIKNNSYVPSQIESSSFLPIEKALYNNTIQKELLSDDDKNLVEKLITLEETYGYVMNSSSASHNNEKSHSLSTDHVDEIKKNIDDIHQAQLLYNRLIKARNDDDYRHELESKTHLIIHESLITILHIFDHYLNEDENILNSLVRYKQSEAY